jgi:single-stranded-DNA-specific exonuclease
VIPLIRRRETNSVAQAALAVPPLLQRILAARQVLTDADRVLDFQHLHPPQLLKGIDAAVSLLMAQLPAQRRVLIVSDFDADGATSCVLAIRALRAMGFQNVDYIVPNRFEYGYGLTPEIVQLARGKVPDILITVDNGISSIEGVQVARALGMQVIITDHHLPGLELPPADAIVNPNQPGCGFPSKALAGVGVVFYVMAALRSALRDAGWFAKAGIVEPNLAGLLDLVALGTVADVVTLDRNNRILVNEGLKRIRAGRACAGILALLEIGKRTLPALQASDLGFAAGPRLNAAGRLDDMALGIECLLADDPVVAMAMARRLDEMNQQRKGIEEDMRDQAVSDLDALDIGGATAPAGVCIYNPAWHQGVIGILAARIKERLHRPVIAFADAGVDGEGEPQLKGSARSIAGLHIRDVLDTVATRNPGLISRFGGHAMAAGLSLRTRDYPQFCAAFDSEVTALLTDEDLQACVLTDGEVRAEELTLSTAQLLRELGPWGQGFPEPSFEGEFEVLQQRMLGAKHLKLVLCPPGCRQQALDAIAFNVDPALWASCNVARIRAVYRLDVNEYRGQRSLQLVLEHLAPSSYLAER